MKIDYSKWIIVFQDYYGNSVRIDNPSENIQLHASLTQSPIGTYPPVYVEMTHDDPVKHIKELAKKEIKRYYLQQQIALLNGKQIPVEDNLDYVENEAERRGLIDRT